MKKDKKTLVFTIFTIIIGILILINCILFVAFIVDLKNLTFPLTGISGILILLLFMLLLIFLELGLKKWKNDKKSKKYFIAALIILICTIFTFLIASPINTYIRDNNIMYRDLGTKEYTIKGISYEVSKKWEHKEGTDGDYFYPYAGTTDGMLYVTASYDNDFIDADSDVAFDNYIAGMQESDSYGYFKISKKEKIKVLNYNGIKLTYNCTIDKKYYEMQVYVFLDPDSGTLYSFANGSEEKIDTKIKDEVKEVINSIKDKNKSVKKEKEESEKNIESNKKSQNNKPVEEPKQENSMPKANNNTNTSSGNNYMDALRKCSVMEAADIYTTGIGKKSDNVFNDGKETCESWYKQWGEKDFFEAVNEDWKNRKNEEIDGKPLSYYLDILGW